MFATNDMAWLDWLAWVSIDKYVNNRWFMQITMSNRRRCYVMNHCQYRTFSDELIEFISIKYFITSCHNSSGTKLWVGMRVQILKIWFSFPDWWVFFSYEAKVYDWIFEGLIEFKKKKHRQTICLIYLSYEIFYILFLVEWVC